MEIDERNDGLDYFGGNVIYGKVCTHKGRVMFVWSGAFGEVLRWSGFIARVRWGFTQG